MKILNIVFKLFLALVVIAGIAVTVLVTLVNPNQFKPILQTQLSEIVGRPITIKGDLDWQFFPRMAINAHKVEIGNAPGFTDPNFAEIDALALKVDGRHLLKREIIIPEISVKKALINLEINSSLGNNWSDFSKTKEIKSEGADHQFQVTAVNIDRLNISDSVIHFRNQATKQILKVSGLMLKSSAIHMGASFPISAKFNFISSEPGANKTVQMSGDAGINGDLTVDVPLWERTHSLIPAISFKGQVELRQAQFDKLHIGEMTSTVAINSSMMIFNPVQAQLYGGKAAGALTANMQTATPGYELHGNFTHINASQFFKDVLSSDRITGTADLSLTLNTAGKSVADMTRGLNGVAKFDFHHGELVGVDLPFLVDSSAAVISKQTVDKKAKTGTPFDTISGSLSINQGEITNPDFLFDSAKIKAHGAGTVDLNSHQVNYRLKAKAAQVSPTVTLGKIQEALGGEFPIIISGTWDNIHAQPDMSALIAARAKVFLKEGLDKVLGNKLGIIPGVGTDQKTGTETGTQEQPATQEKPVDKAKNIIKNLLLPH